MFKIILNKTFSRNIINKIIYFRSLFRKFHSLHQIDKQLSLLLTNQNGFCVEIGANDGVSQSNSLFFERKRGWSGVLVEPSPSTFNYLQKNRNSANYFEKCACISFDYKDSFIDFIYSNLMSVTVHSVENFENNWSRAISGSLFLAKNENVKNFRVPARTLESILISSNAPNLIDFLHLMLKEMNWRS